jgi:hypothetical protein
VIFTNAAASGESSGGALRQALTWTDSVPNVAACPTLTGMRFTRAVILSSACNMATGWSTIEPGGNAD